MQIVRNCKAGRHMSSDWSNEGYWTKFPRTSDDPPVAIQFRSFDGSGNKSSEPDLNAAGTAVERVGPDHFADGISTLRDGPNPRTISNVVVGEGDPNVPNPQGV